MNSDELARRVADQIDQHRIDIKVGDTVIDDDGRIYRIEAFVEDGIDLYDEDEDGWSHYTVVPYEKWPVHEYNNERYVKLDGPYEEVERQVLNSLYDLDSVFGEDDSEEEAVETTDLALSMGKASLVDAERQLQTTLNQMRIAERILKRKKWELQQFVSAQLAKIKQVQKVIGVIELYTGVYEEITQIQVGNPAAADVPVSFRQLLLYMDEEVGDYDDGGIDIKHIEDFDNWLLASADNLNKVLPEIKGVVALRVRRDAKHYSSNMIENWWCNRGNFLTYLLIRNGENIYRIWGDIYISPRLFPRRREFEAMAEDTWESKKIDDQIFDYKRHAILLQGLLDRTDIFSPIDVNIKILDDKTWGGMLNFVFDDDMLLADGRQTWREWKRGINAKIEVGSRIFFITGYDYNRHYKIENRVCANYAPSPGEGVYEVVGPANITYHGHKFKFIYNPGDDIWDQDTFEYHERKKGIGFDFSPSDDMILNYDQISIEDIEFYLSSRVDRPNYLSMLPILREIRHRLLKEREFEAEFVKLVAGRLNADEQKVWRAINWWKYKNKWKRGLAKDDSKALRMIEQKVQNEKAPD